MTANLRILGREIELDCAPCDERRLTDLAVALEARLTGISGADDDIRRLALVALQLIDETQATSAALARARLEIERLTDLVVEAKLEAERPEPIEDERGRVGALRVAQGTA